MRLDDAWRLRTYFKQPPRAVARQLCFAVFDICASKGRGSSQALAKHRNMTYTSLHVLEQVGTTLFPLASTTSEHMNC